MISEKKVRGLLAKLLPNWLFCGADSSGISGGFLSTWNPRKVDFYACVTSAWILLEGTVKYISQRLKFLNCYGPYSKRLYFWETVKKEGLFNEHNLVFSGGLNLTTSCREVWRENARVDPLQLYFS